jgi:hypothetical protein
MEIDELVKLVSKNYMQFYMKTGSDHIATRSSQLNLLRLLYEYNPERILDWGAGIGTTTSLCLMFESSCKIDAFERDSWCIQQFRINVPNFRGQILQQLTNSNYDFLIIDDEISRREINKLLRFKKTKIIFVEGWRNRTVGHLSKRLLKHGFAAEYIRSNSQLHLFGENDWEKSGSWFVLDYRGFHPKVLTSWVKRLPKTREDKEVFKEFYFWIGRNIRISSRVASIRDFIRRI